MIGWAGGLVPSKIGNQPVALIGSKHQPETIGLMFYLSLLANFMVRAPVLSKEEIVWLPS